MKFVTLKGLNQRGKSRVANFSKDGFDGVFKLKDQEGQEILVESIEDNFSLGDKLVPWAGWLEIGVEIEVVSMKIKT